MMVALWLIVGLMATVRAGPVTFRDGVYDGFVISIGDDVPAMDCSAILSNLEFAISTASATLRTALDGRATLGETVVMLPDSWPDSCVPTGPSGGATSISPSNGETPDMSVQRVDPAMGALLYTQQSRGCGQPGDQIYLSHSLLEEPLPDLGRRLVREFAKYRYGVFDEFGYDDDPVYPACYNGDDTERLSLTSCSDLPLDGDHGVCQSGAPANLSLLVQPSARSSLMFAPALHHVDHFCDAATHDRLAPTKQNMLCGRRSIMEVINVHDDFQVEPRLSSNSSSSNSNALPSTPVAPSFVYKRQTLTRYVLVIEDTKDMLVRDSWLFLRTAVRKWANLDLPVNAEAGLVLVNDSSASRLVAMQTLSSQAARGLVSSNLPYSPGDSHAPACLACGLREALDMLEERARLGGAASSVVILMAPGSDAQADLLAAARDAAARRGPRRHHQLPGRAAGRAAGRGRARHRRAGLHRGGEGVQHGHLAARDVLQAGHRHGGHHPPLLPGPPQQPAAGGAPPRAQ